MTKSKSGFTIVELLIVIVVIAILAAISVVAYTGIQQRAGNAQRIAAAREWVEAIKQYIAANQSYPTSLASPTLFCIGESNITDLDADPNVDCGMSNNVKHNSSTYTPAFNNAILTLRSSLPDFPGKPVQMTSTVQGSGMLFRAYDTYDPSGENIPNYPTLIFFLEGPDQDCVLRPLATQYGGGNFTMTTAKNSGSDVGTACRVILPDPRNL
jgi:prepilin-type N-terminal cleavage/methylation domain-containing protein